MKCQDIATKVNCSFIDMDLQATGRSLVIENGIAQLYGNRTKKNRDIRILLLYCYFTDMDLQGTGRRLVIKKGIILVRLQLNMYK